MRDYSIKKKPKPKTQTCVSNLLHLIKKKKNRYKKPYTKFNKQKNIYP